MRQLKQDITIKLTSVYERKASDNVNLLIDEMNDESREGKASKLLLKLFNFRIVPKIEKNRYDTRLSLILNM
jgi:hypothetical protein